jgi:hypothetical protein
LRNIAVEQAVPTAVRAISSLPDIGYEPPRAVAVLVRNSVPALSRTPSIDLYFDDADSSIRTPNEGSYVRGGAWRSCCTTSLERSRASITACLRKTALGNGGHLWSNRC